MRVFAGDDLRATIMSRVKAMQLEVEKESAKRLLNVNEAEYVEYLVQTHRIDPLVLVWDGLTVSSQERMIPAELFPLGSYMHGGKSYPKQVVTYHIPFTGDASLLGLKPSTYLMWTTDVVARGGEVLFDIINWRDDADEIKREADTITSNMKTQAANVQTEVASFNDDLRVSAESLIRTRKQMLLQQANLLESLGVPLKRSDRTPETFAVPTVRRKVVVKPLAPDAAYAPEPTLDETLYHDILRLCHDTGVEMERHPSIYAEKGEPTLRDHFIMVLSPHFDSVTGETFNRGGDTDILVRHESANVFVAECKFWDGKKSLAGAITQVLGYLTWRDSKAAIIMFVPTKQLQPVLDQIQPTAEEHDCWVSTAAATQEGWFNFNFHLPKDSTRGVKLAVLCFHLPR